MFGQQFDLLVKCGLLELFYVFEHLKFICPFYFPSMLMRVLGILLRHYLVPGSLSLEREYEVHVTTSEDILYTYWSQKQTQ